MQKVTGGIPSSIKRQGLEGRLGNQTSEEGFRIYTELPWPPENHVTAQDTNCYPRLALHITRHAENGPDLEVRG